MRVAALYDIPGNVPAGEAVLADPRSALKEPTAADETIAFSEGARGT